MKSVVEPTGRLGVRALVRVYCFCALIQPCAHEAAIGAPPVRSVKDDNVIAEFDVTPGGDLVCLPFVIDGRSYPFAIATGCSYWVFDESLRERLRPLGTPDRPVMTPGGSPLYAPPDGDFAGFPPPAGGSGVCLPFHDGLLVLGQNCRGFAGCQFLRDTVFSIDFDRGKVTFLRRAKPDFGERFQFEMRDLGGGNVPCVHVDLPGGAEPFLINTSLAAFTAGSIRRERFDALMASGAVSPIDFGEQQSFRFGVGVVAVRNARLPLMKLGTCEHQGLVFSDGFMSELGLGYLSRYVVTFDFPARHVYFRRGKQYARREQYDRAGIPIGRIKERTIVGKVLKGWPGEAAGLEPLDELVSIDRLTAADTSVFELCRAFAIPGDRDVVFLRNGKKMRTTVIMRDE